MTIPTKKLDYWSQKGATQAPKNLREKIEKYLLLMNRKLRGKINLISIFKDLTEIIRISLGVVM